MKTSTFDHWKFTPDIVKLWNLKSGRIFKWKTIAKFTKAHLWQISFQSSWFSAIFSPVINLYPSTASICLFHCLCLLFKVFHHEDDTYIKTTIQISQCPLKMTPERSWRRTKTLPWELLDMFWVLNKSITATERVSTG